jgi:hypothetical protein
MASSTFLITSSHASKCQIIELASTDYTAVRCRAVVNSGGTYYFEVYDTANSISSGTAQTWHCCFIPLLDTTLTIYTSFTDGSTVPSGYTAVNDITTTNGSAGAAIKNITRNGLTFTATRQDGGTFTFTQQDNNTAVASSTTTVGSASGWSAGTLPTLDTAIAADDITAWSAGTAPSLTVTSVACDDITAWSAGTLPTLGTAIPADDITAWSAGSLPSLTYNSTNHSLTFSQGTLPSLSYTAKSIPNVTGVGTLPSLSYTARSVGSASNWSAGTVPSLSYTARSIPNISVTSTTVATGGIN